MTPTKQNAREELIKELKEWAYASNNTMISIYKVADFILEDRKRVVEPLVKFKTRCLAHSHNCWGNDSGKAIDQTLKNAGVQS